MAETFRREKRLGLSEDEEQFRYIHIAFPDLSGLSYGIMKELYRTSSAGGFFTHHGVVLCSLYNPNRFPSELRVLQGLNSNQPNVCSSPVAWSLIPSVALASTDGLYDGKVT